MPLRQSPLRTPALLAANRANAQKSTGPRTPQGKARVALNALKHGRYAVGLREKLVQAGDRSAEGQYRWIRSEIAATFGVGGPADQRQAEQLAASVWCQARQAGGSRTKPECALASGSKRARQPSLSRIRIEDRLRRIGLMFWVQRPRYWTLERQLRVLGGEGPLAAPPPGRAREQRWRRRWFRLRKPGLWERMGLEEEMSRRCHRQARRINPSLHSRLRCAVRHRPRQRKLGAFALDFPRLRLVGATPAGRPIEGNYGYHVVRLTVGSR